jgi:hypothetical protein
MNQIVQFRETDPAEMGKTGTSWLDGEVSSHCFPQVSWDPASIYKKGKFLAYKSPTKQGCIG